MEEQRPIRPMSPSGPTPASGGEAAAQASKPPSLQTSDAGARSARVRSDLAREELETVKRTLRAVEAQANAADPASTPASAPSGDYIRTTFRRAGASSIPAAWMVRSRVVEENNEQKTIWELYSPLWSTGRTCAYAPGMASGWNRLNVTGGVLYAWLTWTGTKSGDAVTWTPGATQIGNALGDIPADREPTDETPGSKTTVVQIGLFTTQNGVTTFTQEHLGVIVEGAPGGGGGGVSAEALALGPLTEVTDAAGTRYVRYLGTWKVVDGTPTFVRASGEDGAVLPPAETLTPTFVQLLFRQTSTSGSSGYEEATGIGYVRVPVFFPGQLMDWMTRQTPTLQDRLTYAAPLSETDTGSVTAASTKLSYFSDEAPTSGPAEELFLVQVEEANEAAHYSTDAGGN